jgi:hypothetical protein
MHSKSRSLISTFVVSNLGIVGVVAVAALALLAASAVGCGKRESSASGNVAIVGNYDLDCASSNTATAAQLYCVRTDTRTGDVMRVNYMSLPTTEGRAAAAAATGAAGRFTTACAATSTDIRSDFYCIRMNTETGEMQLLNLQKTGVIPPAPGSERPAAPTAPAAAAH